MTSQVIPGMYNNAELWSRKNTESKMLYVLQQWANNVFTTTLPKDLRGSLVIKSDQILHLFPPQEDACLFIYRLLGSMIIPYMEKFEWDRCSHEWADIQLSLFIESLHTFNSNINNILNVINTVDPE